MYVTTIKKISILILSFISCACVTFPPSTPPKKDIISDGVNINQSAFSKISPPMNSTRIANTDYYVFQTRGGSILLGPIFGALNIQAQTNEMAEKLKNSIVSIDASKNLNTSLVEVGLKTNSSAKIQLRPAVIMQRTVDDKFRLSLYVQAMDNAKTWESQYAYHLPSTIDMDNISNLNSKQTEKFKEELDRATKGIANLIKKDFSGELPTTGEPYYVGSKNLYADRIGGIGIYSEPEELYYQNSSYIGKNGENIIIRFSGYLTMHTFGLHVFEPGLLHKFEPIK